MSTPPANWYPDPAGTANLRYWDGTAWTNNLRPMDAPAAPPEVRPMPLEPNPVFRKPDPVTEFFPTGAAPAPSTRASKGSPRLFGILLLIMGLGFTILPLGAILITQLGLSLFDIGSSAGDGAVETSGQIIELQSDGADCTPIASFVVDGETYTAVSKVTISPCNTTVGSAATVSYLPDSIGSSAVVVYDDGGFTDAFKVIFLVGPGIFVIIGILMTVGAIYLIRKNPKDAS